MEKEKMKSTYNINLSYEANYTAGPDFEGQLPDLAALNAGLPPATFLGYRVNSTLGVPAGPLLNAAYIALYARLGFDVLTYKTVRTGYFPAHPFPNVRPVATSPGWYQSIGDKPSLYTLQVLDESQPPQDLSITNSFGMPSREPAVWRADVAQAKASLQAGQVLVVSVVGTAHSGGSLEELAHDFAQAAAWAAEAGADVIEANLSCPNVSSGEGSLYQSPAAVGTVARALAAALGGPKQKPFLLKMGYLADPAQVRQVVEAAAQAGAAGLAAINTIPAKVYQSADQAALPGEGRLVSGICGAGIKEAGMAMTARLLAARDQAGLSKEAFALVGVGGVMTGSDALAYLKLGADGVQSGTGAMWNPYLAVELKQLLKAPVTA
jgi:dihydroorotate dehydrogenase (NAD+) catalytic subunit